MFHKETWKIGMVCILAHSGESFLKIKSPNRKYVPGSILFISSMWACIILVTNVDSDQTADAKLHIIMSFSI